jgi:hypothetical protein
MQMQRTACSAIPRRSGCPMRCAPATARRAVAVRLFRRDAPTLVEEILPGLDDPTAQPTKRQREALKRCLTDLGFTEQVGPTTLSTIVMLCTEGLEGARQQQRSVPHKRPCHSGAAADAGPPAVAPASSALLWRQELPNVLFLLSAGRPRCVQARVARSRPSLPRALGCRPLRSWPSARSPNPTRTSSWATFGQGAPATRPDPYNPQNDAPTAHEPKQVPRPHQPGTLQSCWDHDLRGPATTRQRVRLAPRFHGTQNMQQVLTAGGGGNPPTHPKTHPPLTRTLPHLSTHLDRMRRTRQTCPAPVFTYK